MNNQRLSKKRSLIRTQSGSLLKQGLALGWHKYVGADGGIVAMDSFGASAPYKTLFEHFGLTAEAVANEAKKRL